MDNRPQPHTMAAPPPPAYDGAASSYPDDKKGPVPPYSAGQAASSSSAAPQDLSIHGGGQPMVMHVYRDRTSKFSMDDVIMAEDKVTVLYYFHHPSKWSGKWDSSFHRSAKDGPLVCHITKSAYKDSKEFTMANGYEFKLRKPKFLSRMHEFITQDGVHWEWKGDGIMTMDFTLKRYLSDGQQQEVAKWDQSNWAMNKDGKLFINSLYKDSEHLDVIVATAIAMEEWQNEQNRQAAGAA